MKKSLKKSSGKKKKKQLKKLFRKMRKEYKFSFLMSQVTAVHSVTAVLGMPQGKDKRIKLATEIVAACTDNANVAVDIAILDGISEDIASYKSADSGSNKDAWRLVKNGLGTVMSLFQTAANNDNMRCKSIIHSGKFKVKEIGLAQKRKFKAKNSGLEGEVILTAQGGGQNTCHDWSHSPDGVNFVRLPPTIAGKTKVKELVAGKYGWFTHELVTTKGGQGISQMIKIMVA